jgi:dienelactone hydrolase
MTGTMNITLTDRSRTEVLGKKKGFRKVTVRFYWPSADTETAGGSSCLTDINRKWLGKNFSLYDSRISLHEGQKIRDGAFPLIVFNHGYGGFTEQNNDLCQYLAEHGYIIASVGHPYEAGETVFDDGTSALFDRSLYLKMFRPFIPAVIDLARLRKKKLNDEEALQCFGIHQNRYEAFVVSRVDEWLKDDRFALDAVRRMNEDPDSVLYRKIDFSNGIGITGHSYGGALAYAHCLYDEGISCGVNIDGGLFGNYGDAVNHKPFMQLVHKGNENVVSRSRLFHDRPVHYLLFRDVEHNGFTDKKLVSRKVSEVGRADPVLTLDTLNELHLAFFDRYLKEADTECSDPLFFSRTLIERYDIL